MADCELILLSPDGPEWNPHSDAFAHNEEKLLDWREDIIEAKDRQCVLIEDTDKDAFLSSLSVAASDYDLTVNTIIDKVCDGATVMATEAKVPDWDMRNDIEDEVSPSLCRISNTLDPSTFATDLIYKCIDSKFGMTIGSMHGTAADIDDLFTLDAGAAHAEPLKGVSAKDLSRLWRIDLDSASEHWMLPLSEESKMLSCRCHKTY